MSYIEALDYARQLADQRTGLVPRSTEQNWRLLVSFLEVKAESQKKAALATPAQEHATPLAGQGAEVIENLLRLAQIVDRAVEDWGESFPDGSCDVKFHKDEAVKMEATLEFFDSLPDAPEDEGVIESGPLKAARAIRAAAPAQAQEDASDALTLEELDQLDRAIEHFVEGEDTDVDWRLLTRAASLGYLECERFTVPPTARAAIDAARAAQGGDKP